MSRSDAGGGDGAEVWVVLVTAPDDETAARLAREVVGSRLAACVNVLGAVRSIYRWEGRVEDEGEVLMVIKTRADRCDALAQRIGELHPYDVPEVLALPAVGGSAGYLDWVRAESNA